MLTKSRGVLALHDWMSDQWQGPDRTESSSRSTDAAQLTFPLRLLILIICGIVAITGAFWFATWSLRSDVRDILTKMQDKEKVDEAIAKLQDERAMALKDAIAGITRQQQMQYYDIQELKRDVAVLKAQGVKP